MHERRERSPRAKAAIAAGIALGLAGEMATAGMAKKDSAEPLKKESAQEIVQQKEFTAELTSIQKALSKGDFERASVYAEELLKKIEAVADSSSLGPQVFELSEYFRLLDQPERQIQLLRSAYDHARDAKTWRAKFEFGEDLARLFAVAGSAVEARNVYEHMRGYYQGLIADGVIIASDYKRPIRASDGDEELKEVYSADNQIFETYVKQRLGEF